MNALWLESVLVGYIIDGVLLSIRSHPLNRSVHSKRSMIGADVLQFGGLLTLNAVAGLVTVSF